MHRQFLLEETHNQKIWNLEFYIFWLEMYKHGLRGKQETNKDGWRVHIEEAQYFVFVFNDNLTNMESW